MTEQDVFETVNIDQMTFNEGEQTYEYDCVCGDKFKAPLAELKAQYENDKFKGFFIAPCPSCSLVIKVLFDGQLFEKTH